METNAKVLACSQPHQIIQKNFYWKLRKDTYKINIICTLLCGIDINECKDGLACQCNGCTCKNTWGGYDCKCKGNLLYIKGEDTCIGKHFIKRAKHDVYFVFDRLTLHLSEHLQYLIFIYVPIDIKEIYSHMSMQPRMLLNLDGLWLS